MDLVGEWIGEGSVLPKGIKYKERLTLTMLKTKPLMVIEWRQSTKNAETGDGMHAENGFLRIGESGAELLLSHPFGVNELYKNCVYEPGTLEATATEAGRSFQRGAMAKGKETTTVRRSYKLQGPDSLFYDVYLGTGGEEPQHHLHCELHRSA